MLGGYAKIAQKRFRINIGANSKQQRSCARAHGSVVNQSEAVSWRMAEEDIFSDSQLIKQDSFLMNGRYTGQTGVVSSREGHA